MELGDAARKTGIYWCSASPTKIRCSMLGQDLPLVRHTLHASMHNRMRSLRSTLMFDVQRPHLPEVDSDSSGAWRVAPRSELDRVQVGLRVRSATAKNVITKEVIKIQIRAWIRAWESFVAMAEQPV